MQLLTGIEANKVIKHFDACAHEALRSQCLRARCAAVIVKNDEIVAQDHNSPPLEKPEHRTCLDEYEIPSGFRHDRTCCMHAEQRTIAQALKTGADMTGARIYFVNIDDQGQKIFATSLKCTICSRAVLDAGITEFALYCEDGIRVYDAVDFNQQSYAYKTPRK